MKKILITMATVSVLAMAAPAAAQYSNNNPQNGYQNRAYGNGSLSVRIDQLEARFQAGVRTGAISRREATPLRRQLRQLSQLERQYAVNGISGRERADLQQRMRTVRQQIRIADGNNQARWDVYDREDGYGRWEQSNGNVDYGRNGEYDRNYRVDSNNDGYDDRDYDRDGRWDDDNRYEQPARSGIGGVVDAVFGTGGLRVGQQASTGLYGVPNEYRDQYRDGNGSYYRSDGRQIYQIDSRSHAVVRVFAMNR
jgi:hypothetical protein